MPSSFFSCGRDRQMESSGLACSHLMWLLKASPFGGFGPGGVYLASHRCFLHAGLCFSPLHTRAEISCEGIVAAGGAPLEWCPVSSLPGFLSVCASLLSIACWWLLSQGVADGAECGPVTEEHRPDTAVARCGHLGAVCCGEFLERAVLASCVSSSRQPCLEIASSFESCWLWTPGSPEM